MSSPSQPPDKYGTPPGSDPTSPAGPPLRPHLLALQRLGLAVLPTWDQGKALPGTHHRELADHPPSGEDQLAADYSGGLSIMVGNEHPDGGYVACIDIDASSWTTFREWMQRFLYVEEGTAPGKWHLVGRTTDRFAGTVFIRDPSDRSPGAPRGRIIAELKGYGATAVRSWPTMPPDKPKGYTPRWQHPTPTISLIQTSDDIAGAFAYMLGIGLGRTLVADRPRHASDHAQLDEPPAADLLQAVEAALEQHGCRLSTPNHEGWQTGLCPLHEDRHPSFSINLRSGGWVCFAGCGSGSLIGLSHRLSLPLDRMAAANESKVTTVQGDNAFRLVSLAERAEREFPRPAGEPEIMSVAYRHRTNARRLEAHGIITKTWANPVNVAYRLRDVFKHLGLIFEDVEAAGGTLWYAATPLEAESEDAVRARRRALHQRIVRCYERNGRLNGFVDLLVQSDEGRWSSVTIASAPDGGRAEREMEPLPTAALDFLADALKRTRMPVSIAMNRPVNTSRSWALPHRRNHQWEAVGYRAGDESYEGADLISVRSYGLRAWEAGEAERMERAPGVIVRTVHIVVPAEKDEEMGLLALEAMGYTLVPRVRNEIEIPWRR